MKIDVEVYLNQFITFFDKHPESLIELIGEIDRDLFFDKVKEQCYVNIDNGEDVSLTKSQIIEIVGKLFSDKKNETITQKTNFLFQNTSFGKFCLN